MKAQIYYNIWMNNGIENLYRIFKELKGIDNNVELHETYMEFTIPSDNNNMKNFVMKLKEKIENKRDKVIFIREKDKKTGKWKKTKKRFVLLQYGKQQKGEKTLKEKIYSPGEMEKTIEEIFNLMKISNSGEKVCILCNNNYSKPIDKLKQAVCPLVTKIKSLSGVRSMKEYYDICPLCCLIGTLEWTDECIVYHCGLGGDKRNHSIALLPNMHNLKALHNFKEIYKHLLNSDENISNIKIKIEGGKESYCEGKYTLLMAFFEKFFNNVYLQVKEGKKWREYYKIKEEICKDWVCIEIPPESVKVKNIKYIALSLSDSFLRIIYEISKELNGDWGIYSGLIGKISFTSIKQIDSNTLNRIKNDTKETLAECIVKDDFRGFAHAILPRKGGWVVFPKDPNKILEKLINKWKFEKMEMNESDLKNIKDAGKIIAVLAEENPGLIYSVDKSKTPEEFLRALEQVSKKLLKLDDEKRENIYPSALSEVTEKVLKTMDNQKIFGVIRDSLIIFTCVELSKIKYKYIKEKNKDKKNENEQNEPK